MKRNILILLAIVVMASCSAPKHAYYFDHYDYHAGKRKQQTDVLNSHEVVVDDFEQAKLVHEETLLASSSAEVVVIEDPRPTTGDAKTIAKVEKQYSDMSKTEKKEVRKEFRKDLKEYKKAKKSGDEVRAEQAKEKLTGYTRVGVILIIAGLVLAILSLGSVINSIGGLMVLVGIIFILVDIL